MDRTFDHVFEEMRADRDRVTAEMRAEREAFGAEMRAMRGEFRAEFAAVRGDISALQRQITNILTGFAVGLLGVVAAGVAAAVAGV